MVWRVHEYRRRKYFSYLSLRKRTIRFDWPRGKCMYRMICTSSYKEFLMNQKYISESLLDASSIMLVVLYVQERIFWILFGIYSSVKNNHNLFYRNYLSSFILSLERSSDCSNPFNENLSESNNSEYKILQRGMH